MHHERATQLLPGVRTDSTTGSTTNATHKHGVPLRVRLQLLRLPQRVAQLTPDIVQAVDCFGGAVVQRLALDQNKTVLLVFCTYSQGLFVLVRIALAGP